MTLAKFYHSNHIFICSKKQPEINFTKFVFVRVKLEHYLQVAAAACSYVVLQQSRSEQRRRLRGLPQPSHSHYPGLPHQHLCWTPPPQVCLGLGPGSRWEGGVAALWAGRGGDSPACCCYTESWRQLGLLAGPSCHYNLTTTAACTLLYTSHTNPTTNINTKQLTSQKIDKDINILKFLERTVYFLGSAPFTASLFREEKHIWFILNTDHIFVMFCSVSWSLYVDMM